MPDGAAGRSRTTLRVRPATAADAPEVVALAAAAWLDTYEGLLRPATIEAFIRGAYSLERVERRIAGDIFLVAHHAQRIVAFADALERPDRLELAAIYALPAARGGGAGTMLLTALRSRVPGLPVVADVLSGNRKGEIFYERRGFVPRETLEAELAGEPIVERRWWLDPRSTSRENVPMTDPTEIRARLAAVPSILSAAAMAASPEPPAQGEWTPTDIVRHLIAVEDEVWHVRLRQLGAEDHPRWSWVEPGRWQGQPAAPLETLLATFGERRAETLAMLDALGPDGWARTGIHATYGVLDVAGLMVRAVDHDDEHIASLSPRTGS